MENIEYNKILQDSSSFQIVRTNPKLTSNIKFTVDISGNMWLNSMDVTSELANDMYKKFPIDPKFTHATNMYRFYDNGRTPPEVAFASVENIDPTKTSKEYKDQFDFDFYFSGARYFSSKQYDEKLSYFAPLYLKKDMPDYFIIFKVDDPMNYKIDISKSKYPFDKEEYLKDLFKKATLIKTFDLSESSPVGEYMRKYIADVNFPASPLTVDFEKDAYTTFNGILMNSGALGTKSEILDDFYSDSSPLRHFEDYMTAGFERNGIIFPNIFNMEFIFDDETSEDYDFNRYVGFYINKIELEKLNTDIVRIYEERATWENTPRIRREIKENEEIYLKQVNPLGVLFPYSNTSLEISEFNDSFDNKERFFLNYINDRDDNLYSFTVDDNPIIPDLDNVGNELDTGKIRLANTEVDMGKFFGPGRAFIQDDGFASNARGYSNSYIRILSELNNLDEIKFYHPNGTRTDVNGRYDKMTAAIGYSLVPNPGDFYFYNDIDGVVGNDTFYFNATGTLEQIASAIEGCLKEFSHISYRVIRMNEYVFIKVGAPGDHDDKFKLEFFSDLNIYTTIEIKETTGTDLIGNVLTFSGGSKGVNNKLVINAENRQKIENNINDLLVKTENGWSKIKKVSNYFDLVTEKNALSEAKTTTAIRDYFDKITITLELNDRPAISYKDCNISFIHRPSFGFISFLPIRDFDFDYYASEYLNFPINDLYKYYFIPPDEDLIKPPGSNGPIEYQVFGEGTIEFNDYQSPLVQINSESTATGINYDGSKFWSMNGASYATYTVISGNPVVSNALFDVSGFPPDMFGSNMNAVINDENGEFTDFEGFFLLKDPSKIVPEETTTAFTRREKYLNGIAATEYDFYKENDTKDFALKSKMVPYITKWALLNGKDSRSNPYRLNTELMFGYNNFSPSHDDTTQNPSNFTHEWYFLESSFDYVLTEDTIKLNNGYFDEPLDITKLLSEEDYFVNYFTYTPTFGGIEVGKTQTRYSIISKNASGEFETFLKGFKSKFRDVINPNDIGADGKPIFNPNSNRFEDYKFSSLLKFVEEDINDPTQQPVTYKFIEQKDFKFILLLVEVVVGSNNAIARLWKAAGMQYQVFNAPGAINTNLWKVDNLNFLDAPVSPYISTQFYDSINGDYKINFSTDVTTGLDISDATYALLYCMKHKKYDILLDRFSNIKLSAKLDLNVGGATSTKIPGVSNPAFPSYPVVLNEEINCTLNPSTFIMPRFMMLNQDRFIDKNPAGLGVPENVSHVSSVSSESISLDNPVPPAFSSYAMIDTTNIFVENVPSFTPQSIFVNHYVYKMMVSGENYYEHLTEKISFARFKEYVNSASPIIEYESWSLNPSGTPTMATIPKYYLDIPDNETVTKTTGLVPLSDENKPSEFSSIDIIGYDYFTTPLDNNYDLNRYRGGYEPIFKDVLFFNSTYKFLDNNIESLELSNVKFNINVTGFGDIANFNHLKIADIKILSLEANESFNPVYELINEIAIGNDTYFLFDSNWDYGFHFKYSTKSNYSPVAGTLRIEEDDSFIGKLVTLPNEIELEQYQVLTLSETESLNSVNIDEVEIVVKEESSSVKGFININNVLTKYFIDNGIDQKFNEYLVNQEEFIGAYEDIESYVKAYIAINILPLYEISEIEMYSKDDRKIVSRRITPRIDNDIEFVFLTDKERFEQGYLINKNLEINKFRSLVLDFTFKKKIKSGMLVSPKIKIKFI